MSKASASWGIAVCLTVASVLCVTVALVIQKYEEHPSAVSERRTDTPRVQNTVPTVMENDDDDLENANAHDSRETNQKHLNERTRTGGPNEDIFLNDDVLRTKRHVNNDISDDLEEMLINAVGAHGERDGVECGDHDDDDEDCDEDDEDCDEDDDESDEDDEDCGEDDEECDDDDEDCDEGGNNQQSNTNSRGTRSVNRVDEVDGNGDNVEDPEYGDGADDGEDSDDVSGDDEVKDNGIDGREKSSKPDNLAKRSVTAGGYMDDDGNNDTGYETDEDDESGDNYIDDTNTGDNHDDLAKRFVTDESYVDVELSLGSNHGKRPRERGMNEPFTIDGDYLEDDSEPRLESEEDDKNATRRGYSSWSPWRQCSVSCGLGRSARIRSCLGFAECSRDDVEARPCVRPPCPV